MVSMLGSMKAERAPDSRNFLAHSKESGLISRPIKKAAHNFGTEMRSALGGGGGKAQPRRRSAFWPRNLRRQGPERADSGES
jgi:hypothetical protein